MSITIVEKLMHIFDQNATHNKLWQNFRQYSKQYILTAFSDVKVANLSILFLKLRELHAVYTQNMYIFL